MRIQSRSHLFLVSVLTLVAALLRVESIRYGERYTPCVSIRILVKSHILDVHPPALVACVEDVIGSKGYLQMLLQEESWRTERSTPHCEHISFVMLWPRVEPVMSNVISQLFDIVKMFFGSSTIIGESDV